jgi:hypothetical protein
VKAKRPQRRPPTTVSANRFWKAYNLVPGLGFTMEATDKVNRMGAPTWIWRFLQAHYKLIALELRNYIQITTNMHGSFVMYVYEANAGPIFLEVVGNEDNIVVYDTSNRAYRVTVPIVEAAELQDFIESRSISLSKQGKVSKPTGVIFSCFAEGFLSLPERRICALGGFPLVRWKIEASTDTLIDGMVVPIEKMRNLDWAKANLNHVTCEQLAKLMLEWVITLRDGLASVKVSITPERGADARGVTASWTKPTTNPWKC